MFLVPTFHRFWHREAFERSRPTWDEAPPEETANQQTMRTDQAHAEATGFVQRVQRHYAMERRPFL